MGIHSHTPVCQRSKCCQFRKQLSMVVEEFFGLVALHPTLKNLQVLRLAFKISNRDLMGAEGAFDGQAIDCLWAGPAFGCPQNNHRPPWADRKTMRSSI